MTSRSILANHSSTWFSHEEYVGMKCSRTFGCVSRKSRTACVLCADRLSRIMWISCLGRHCETTSPRNPRSRRWCGAPPFFRARAPSWCRVPRTATACHAGNTRTRGARRGPETAAAPGPNDPAPESLSFRPHKTRLRAAVDSDTARSHRRLSSRSPDRRWPGTAFKR